MQRGQMRYVEDSMTSKISDQMKVGNWVETDFRAGSLTKKKFSQLEREKVHRHKHCSPTSVTGS